MRLEGKEAALQFIAKHFPDCSVAVLAGSVVTGRATARSDLDLVIFDDSQPSPFRACYREFGWPIEAFVLTTESYRYIFEMNQLRAIPSIQRMCADGTILKDDGTADALIREAKEMLREGPWPWTEDEILQARYEITECLEDLAGSSSRAEDLFTVNRLAGLVQEMELRMHGCWTGEGKWVVRSLRMYDETFCRELVQELDLFYKMEQKEGLIAFVDRVLAPYGGRLFEGFRQEDERSCCWPRVRTGTPAPIRMRQGLSAVARWRRKNRSKR
ncbi:nucleotidyltransferase domain-containing protein [Gordoniibacillus kamchatkensis]|uniref:nucleotidyltransferase domain-containing protein n=1 Tax=Gordoniibacillus kamchatkensis TaxID=1590651 RepID=UPI000AB215A4|nr:nucleotidyltransferase domain-containing protein [Paenibacillus sp. VKM B-2647]